MLRILVSDIGIELGHIDTLLSELAIAIETKTPLARRSIGSILHDFYTCCERIFRRIAVDLNGGLEETEQWHKTLLYRMTIPVEGVRPPVLSEELASELDEYLAFRHVFRNIYGFELKGERIIRLSERLPEVAGRLKDEIAVFRKLMQQELDAF
jgi:hypothetical protein